MIEFQAEVVDVRQESRGRWQLLLDRTEFSPKRWKGMLTAVAPSGMGIEVAVLGVVAAAGEVWHVVEKPLGVGVVVAGSVS